jgi:hypothetical protein
VETEQSLESGYGPHAPAGDNLLNTFAQAEADAFAELARGRGERILDDEEFALTMTDGGSPTPLGNIVMVRRPLLADEWPAAARRMHDFFAQSPGGPFLTFCPWPTPDVRRLGFGAVGHPPLMLRGPGPLDLPDVDGIEIRPVTDGTSAADFERALVDGFPVPELAGAPAGGLIGVDPAATPNWRHFVAYEAGRPVASGSGYVDAHHVHVEFIATVEDVRGRGVGAAITGAATRTAPDLPAMLIASDLGRPVYERLGYVTLLRFTLWAGHRGAG